MQIIEQTGLGVRSAVMRFERTGSSVKFVVVPMMHIASPAFYRDVRRRLTDCDVVVAEGVGGARAQFLTLAYRLAGRFRRKGLVQQADALRLTDLRAQIVRPDLSAKEFSAGWAGVRWWVRCAALVVVPFVGIAMLVVGPVRMLGTHMALDDMPSDDEEDQPLDDVGRVLIESRDQRLVAELVRQAEAHHADPQPWTVGVPWGAGHVRAIAPALISRGYQVRSAEWITVI